MIYFIVCREANAVKIGVTKNDPWKRLGNGQTHCPLRLELRGLVPGSFAEERELLERFASYRIHGEWFRLEGELADHVANLSIPEEPTRTARSIQQGRARVWS